MPAMFLMAQACLFQPCTTRKPAHHLCSKARLGRHNKHLKLVFVLAACTSAFSWEASRSVGMTEALDLSADPHPGEVAAFGESGPQLLHIVTRRKIASDQEQLESTELR